MIVALDILYLINSTMAVEYIKILFYSCYLLPNNRNVPEYTESLIEITCNLAILLLEVQTWDADIIIIILIF